MGSYDDARALRERLAALVAKWRNEGSGSRQAVLESAEALIRWRWRHTVPGLWGDRSPMLCTATLDDAVGQGLAVIESFAGAMGMTVVPLGLRQTPASILDACACHRPAYLGITVLWADTESDLARVGRHLPSGTRLIAGGPAFVYDPDLAVRCGVHHVAADVAAFVDFMLTAPNPLVDGSACRHPFAWRP